MGLSCNRQKIEPLREKVLVDLHNCCLQIEPRHEKTNVLVSDLVRHKPGCTATEDG